MARIPDRRRRLVRGDRPLHGQPDVRERFRRTMSMPHGTPAARAYAAEIESLLRRLERVFRGRYTAEKATVRADAAWMRGVLRSE